MLRMIGLVCALATPPAECNRDTAVSVLFDRKVTTPYECAVGGMQSAAGTGLIERGNGTYLKLDCARART